MTTSTASKSSSKTTTRKPADKKPAANADIKITAKKRGTISVNLVGKEYEAVPPKAIISMKFGQVAQEAGEDANALVEALFEWLELTFDDQAEQIKERLYSPKDDLDFPHVVELMQKLTEQSVEGNPTT